MTTIKNIKVQQMTSPRSGRQAANQFQIITPEGTYLQSYSSTIAFRDNKGAITLDESKWDYSVTTSRYRNEFLNEGIAETRKKIASGEYKLADLN